MSAVATRARLPAFGKSILDLRRKGLVPAPHPWFGHCIVCLDSWRWAQRYTRLVVPTDADPSTLDFSMLAGLSIYLAYSPAVTTIARRDTTIRRLLAAQVASLRVVDLDEPVNGFWVKSLKVGLELQEYA